MSAISAAQATGALPGSEFPLGATVTGDGTNFAVASEVADGMVLCLFDAAGAETRVPMRDYDAGVWHVFVRELGRGRPTGTGRRVPGIRPAVFGVIPLSS